MNVVWGWRGCNVIIVHVTSTNEQWTHDINHRGLKTHLRLKVRRTRARPGRRRSTPVGWDACHSCRSSTTGRRKPWRPAVWAGAVRVLSPFRVLRWPIRRHRSPTTIAGPGECPQTRRHHRMYRYRHHYHLLLHFPLEIAVDHGHHPWHPRIVSASPVLTCWWRVAPASSTAAMPQ